MTSYCELTGNRQEAECWNRLHPLAGPRRSYAETALAESIGPVVAATDCKKAMPEQIRPFMTGRRYSTLGTDRFGRSGTRQALRAFFGVDRHHIALAALKTLADDGVIEQTKVAAAIARYAIDIPEGAV